MSGTLTFYTFEVERLLEHTMAAKKHEKLYDIEGTDKPGLLLVGDSGVYFMSNGRPGPSHKGDQHIAVAVNCNPKTNAFDDWWAVKQATFGGDDGCEFVDAETIQRWVKEARRKKRPTCTLRMSSTKYEFIS